MEQSQHQAPEEGAENAAEAAPAADEADAGAAERIAELEAELQRLQAAAEQERENALREQADMVNLRKRLQLEVDKSRRFALEKVMNDFLPVVDSLEATLNSEQASLEQLREGAELTLKMMTKLVGDHGVSEINPLHQSFNPELHQAMSMQASDEHADNTVLQVFQKGYQLHERLLRPALVVVAQSADSD